MFFLNIMSQILDSTSYLLYCHVCHVSPSLTVELGSEAETIITLIFFVPIAIVSNTSWGVLTSALVPGMRDRVLN